jgi:hypothetical protein
MADVFLILTKKLLLPPTGVQNIDKAQQCIFRLSEKLALESILSTTLKFRFPDKFHLLVKLKSPLTLND